MTYYVYKNPYMTNMINEKHMWPSLITNNKKDQYDKTKSYMI